MKNSVPGPGVYDLRDKKDGPSFSIRPKFQVTIKDPVPGPGQYQLKNNLVFGKAPAWIVGKQQKEYKSLNQDLVANPGPGSYEKNSTLAGPQWTFAGDKKKQSSCMKVPGPGTYKTQTVFANYPNYVNIGK